MTKTTTTIAHLTDIHMNLPTAITIGKFIKACNKAIEEDKIDCFVLTGDISEAPHVKGHIKILKDYINKPIYFICGNHDFYQGSIEYVRNDLKETFSGTYLTTLNHNKEDIIVLNEKLAIVGHDGWYDGLYANWHTSKLLMGDYQIISEFKPLYHNDLLIKIRELASQAANHIEMQTKIAIEELGCKHVVIATHVPPFRENSVYQNKISDDDWMPHFSSKIMGDKLLDLADRYPLVTFTALCGHSHGKATYVPKANLTCHTGAARYGEPKISKLHIIDIFDD